MICNTLFFLSYQRLLSDLQQFSSYQRPLSFPLALSQELCSSLKAALSSYTLQPPTWRIVQLNDWSAVFWTHAAVQACIQPVPAATYEVALVFMRKIFPKVWLFQWAPWAYTETQNSNECHGKEILTSILFLYFQERKNYFFFFFLLKSAIPL